MPRTVLVLVGLIGLVISAMPALGQSPRKTVILEILLPEDARLLIEGRDGMQRALRCQERDRQAG